MRKLCKHHPAHELGDCPHASNEETCEHPTDPTIRASNPGMSCVIGHVVSTGDKLILDNRAYVILSGLEPKQEGDTVISLRPAPEDR